MDGDDARDFDDAIWAERIKPDNSNAEDDSSYTMSLIMSVMEILWISTQGNEEIRCISLTALSPCCPKTSNGLCSLKPNEDRGCLAVEIIIDKFDIKKVIDLFEG